MRKRIEPTIIEQATESVTGFDLVLKKLEQQVVLKRQSSSTLHNYIRRIASISLHFGRLPEQIDDDEINEYLTSMALNPKSPSRSNFKYAVYGLRYYFRLIGHNKRAISLPSLKKDAKLPTILNRSELKELFAAPQLCAVIFRILCINHDHRVIRNILSILNLHFFVHRHCVA